MGVADKLDPELWKRTKREACRASKPPLHPQRGKSSGAHVGTGSWGDVAGPKRSDSLNRWSRQRWRARDGKLSRGRRRYLPGAA